MDVQILPLGYIGRIIETGDIYLTVRLASGTLVLCRPHIVKAVQREPGYLRKRDDLLGDEP
jgi:hypothetical protein